MKPRIQPPATVVITGASRGIGRRIARHLAGIALYDLLLIARNPKGLQETRRICQKEGNVNVEYLSCDLTEGEKVRSLEIPEGLATVGAVINNAGSYLLKSLSSTTYMDFHQQIEANLFSAVHTTGRFLDEMKERQSGLIVNICSVGSLQGLAESGAYASSKHALLGYTRSLREELKEMGIGVTAVNLGQTASSSCDNSETGRELLIDPEDVANLVGALFRLSSRSVVEELTVQPQRGREET